MFQLLTVLQDVLAEDQLMSKPQSPATMQLEEKVRRIQAGDLELRNQVITDCLPFIKGVLRRMLPVPAIEQADEYSVALSAFNMAMDQYQSETNVPFLRFAGLVINRRVIDWLRQQKRHQQVLTFSQCENDQGASILDNIGSSAVQVWEQMEIEEELVRLRLQLQAFGLSLVTLVDNFPRHRDSRLTCIRIARQLIGDPGLFARLDREHRLPIADLSKLTGIPKKTIENNRQAIIFLTLLLISDLEVIKAYLMRYSKEA